MAVVAAPPGPAPASPGPTPRPATAPVWVQDVALVDILDRLLAGGVVVAGEITLSIADVDLVRISLRALVATVRAAMDLAPDRTP